MEPVTHLLTGACLGRAGFNRKTALATLTLTLATEAADMDMLWGARGSVAVLEHHRGITHTLAGAPFVAAITLGVVYGIYRLLRWRGWQPRSAPRWKLLYVYALLGSLVHIFLDFWNNYGIRPFEPFSYKWYSWDIVFIYDPWILSFLALGLIGPAFLGLITEEVGGRKPVFRGRGGAITALLLVAAVLFVRDFEHRRAVNTLESLTYNNEDPVKVSAFPSMGNPFLWNGVVETPSMIEALVVDPVAGEVDPKGTAEYRYKPEETPVSLAAKKSRLGHVYLDWAQYPVVETQSLPGATGYKVKFMDFRFRRTGPGGTQVLAGYVILGPDLKVTDMYVGDRPRR